MRTNEYLEKCLKDAQTEIENLQSNLYDVLDQNARLQRTLDKIRELTSDPLC